MKLIREFFELRPFPEMKEAINIVLFPREESSPFVLNDREYFIIWTVKGSAIIKETGTKLSWGEAHNAQRIVKGIDSDNITIKAADKLKEPTELIMIRCIFKN